MHFVMLDYNSKINPCALNFDDQPDIGINFVVTGENQQHKLDGTIFVPILYLKASTYSKWQKDFWYLLN